MAGERAFDRYGASARDLEIAWRDRLADAQHLMDAQRYSMAISMGLYALEILLKVRICKRLDLKNLPKPCEIHDLAGLLVLSGLSRSLNKTTERLVKANWTKIKVTASVLNDLRYQPGSVRNLEEAKELFTQLNDPLHGVIPWISRQP